MGVRKYTDDQLREAVPQASNMVHLLKLLGLVPCGGNYETVRFRIKTLGLEASQLAPYEGRVRGRALHTCSDAEIREAVRTARSLAEVLSRLQVRPGRNQDRLKMRIQILGIDISHIKGQGWSRGIMFPERRIPVERVLVVGKLITTSRLKRRLIEQGLKEATCEMCGLDTWNGASIPLELDHINGKRDDNRLINLRLLCPNCHAQTPTYRGRNIGQAEFVS
jgi:hypothetical protein